MKKKTQEQAHSTFDFLKIPDKSKHVLQKINDLSSQDLRKVIEAVDMMELMKQQSIPEEKDLNAIKLILDLFSKRGNVYAAICVFHYGVIQGKRRERMRKDKNKKEDEKL